MELLEEKLMTAQQQILEFYTHPAAMTSGGEHSTHFKEMPGNVAALARIVQGLLLHEHVAAQAYGVELSDERRRESHIRPVERRLDRLRLQDDRPLTVARPVKKRQVGTCRDFTLLLVAMLRAKGVPARARCGFGAYFSPGQFVDHWVCEYWNSAERRWVLVDAQIDDRQQRMFNIDFDLLNVPRDRFVVAGDAWTQCRAGEANPAAFGIFDMNGLWFIAGNLVRDVAALNKMEMLPWDDWGAMPAPDEPLQPNQLTFFDQLASLTHTPDASFEELRALYEDDDRLRVPTTVFNAVLNRHEVVGVG
jgi:hypothetical protein